MELIQRKGKIESTNQPSKASISACKSPGQGKTLGLIEKVLFKSSKQIPHGKCQMCLLPAFSKFNY
jgi:hypothetical protein